MKATYTEYELINFGERLGKLLRPGICIELVGDVGAGKTTLVRGIAKGMGITETIQSPSFTISRTYQINEMTLAHYDFYRLDDPGIMKEELSEALQNGYSVVIVEWADSVESLLPSDRLKISFTPTDEKRRKLTGAAGGPMSSALSEAWQ